ncbi:MAG: hypothetical protein IJ220_00320 [Clostridia bacterium]|nr:hypothetical protein [Clostridia bacterium]
MILKLLLFLSFVIICYLVSDVFRENKVLLKINNYVSNKNEKYYDKLLKYYEKNKKVKLKEKLNYFHKINILIDRCELKRGILINPVSIFVMGIVCVNVAYIISFSFFGIILLSLIISLPFFYLPFALLNLLAEHKEQKIEKIFLNFLLQLKNHTRINNDIVMAMKEVKTVEPLNSYIKKFLIEISSGIKFEKAIENFKEKINIVQIKMFLTNIGHCYLYGGNFSELIDKSYEIISDIQNEKLRRQEETKSARLVLLILIFLDVLVYISFIKSNVDNLIIMKRSILGNMILYWNFISMWLLVLLSIKVKKLDY